MRQLTLVINICLDLSHFTQMHAVVFIYYNWQQCCMGLCLPSVVTFCRDIAKVLGRLYINGAAPVHADNAIVF